MGKSTGKKVMKDDHKKEAGTRMLDNIKKLFGVCEDTLNSCNELAKVSVMQSEIISLLTEEVRKLSHRIDFLEKLDKNKIYIS